MTGTKRGGPDGKVGTETRGAGLQMETKRVVPPTTTLVMLERSEFPVDLAHYTDVDAAPPISAIGDLGILQTRTLALFCSVRCPGRLILQTYDLALALREAGTAVVGASTRRWRRSA